MCQKLPSRWKNVKSLRLKREIFSVISVGWNVEALNSQQNHQKVLNNKKRKKLNKHPQPQKKTNQAPSDKNVAIKKDAYMSYGIIKLFGLSGQFRCKEWVNVLNVCDLSSFGRWNVFFSQNAFMVKNATYVNCSLYVLFIYT